MAVNATSVNRVVVLDEDTGRQPAQATLGDGSDGLAYDLDDTVCTTNETGGPETAFDAYTGQVRGSVRLGGEAWQRILRPDHPAHARRRADPATRSPSCSITRAVTRPYR